MDYLGLLIFVISLVGTIVPVVLFWRDSSKSSTYPCPSPLPYCKDVDSNQACLSSPAFQNQSKGNTCSKPVAIPATSPAPIPYPQ